MKKPIMHSSEIDYYQNTYVLPLWAAHHAAPSVNAVNRFTLRGIKDQMPRRMRSHISRKKNHKSPFDGANLP